MFKTWKIFIIFIALSIAAGNYSGAQCESVVYLWLDELWKNYSESKDPEERANLLIQMGIEGKGNRDVINYTNNFLTEMNLRFKAGHNVDYSMVSACITAIMELSDSSSYPALFSVISAGYPEVIASEAFGALEIIPGNLQLFLYNVIDKNPPEEKFVAFRVGMNSERLNVSERGLLAELALQQALALEENNPDLSAMRYAAVSVLTDLKWTRAGSLAVRHYYRVHSDYLLDNISKDRFIEAIKFLGAVGNSDAALILGLQLGLINARTEISGLYDAELTMAIVQALGSIGYSAAFDHLLHTSYLNYSDDIKDAAILAINRLRWQ